MAEFKDANVIVGGKKLKDWLQSDEGLVDYDKCKFGKNVSNKKGCVIFDLGEFEHDPEVGETVYHKGIDLARVAGAIKYGEPYKGMRLFTALNGDDYVRIFFNNFENATIQDFVMYFVQLLDGDIYISETNYHVFLKGRTYTEEEWKQAVDKLYTKERRRR